MLFRMAATIYVLMMTADTGQWFWWIFMSAVAAVSSWRIIDAARTGRALVTREWGFGRKSEPLEFWFLTSLYLIVVAGTTWMLATGLSPIP
jgi:hypothetical protein